MSSLGLQPGLGASTSSFPSDFRDNVRKGLGLGIGIWLGVHFCTGMFFQDQQNMLTQECV